jgi:hypothetical protein
MLFCQAESNAVMSRSRRSTPIVGLTTSASEKTDKVMAHRRLRHAVKTAVAATVREDGDAPTAETEHPRSGQWTFAKDGKRWIGHRDRRLRK